ncbi:hypothetical protein TNCV_3878111, partial [Trichonephila clavipes]
MFLSDEGIKPDPKKNRAIEEFATPNCKEDLQRFLAKNRLGAVLLQEGQPVAYGYVSLTQTQQRCAQIEKELMAVIYRVGAFQLLYSMEGLSRSRQIIANTGL